MLINRSKVKKEALRLSTELRAGKFHRVSASFFEDVEGLVKEQATALALSLAAPAPKLLNRQLITRTMADAREKSGMAAQPPRVADFERLEQVVADAIRAKVHAHPSIGVTLQGNR